MTDAPPSERHPWVSLNRQEFSGAFGDIGTDLPLLIAMIAAAGLDPAAAFAMFGLAQIASGLAYGLPMPMQPLKAMAVIVIAGGVAPATLYAGGFVIGLIMLALALSGALTRLVQFIPREVVRGIQLGLALSLASLALRDYVPREGSAGLLLAVVAFLAVLLLRGNQRVPPAIPIVVFGSAWAIGSGWEGGAILQGAGLRLPPLLPFPEWADIAMGFVVLALPQLPLSLSNSVIATQRTVNDLFPDRPVTVRQIGVSYGVTNLILPFFGGIPLCHGCGGLAGHHAFGGRTGGSVIIYGSFFLVVGLFLSGAVGEVIRLFPYPLLGVILLFEALTLALLTRDMMDSRPSMTIVLLVALIAANVKQGYVIGMVMGCLLCWLAGRGRLRLD